MHALHACTPHDTHAHARTHTHTNIMILRLYRFQQLPCLLFSTSVQRWQGSLYPRKWGGIFIASFGGSVKPSVLGDWFKLASGYLHAGPHYSHNYGGKSEGMSIIIYCNTCAYNDCYNRNSLHHALKMHHIVYFACY